jgi:hypothetical protein
MISELFFFFFFIYNFLILNSNKISFRILIISIMIIESRIGIFLIFEFYNNKKFLIFNNINLF